LREVERIISKTIKSRAYNLRIGTSFGRRRKPQEENLAPRNIRESAREKIPH
jgi:hypothetical protein